MQSLFGGGKRHLKSFNDEKLDSKLFNPVESYLCVCVTM